jgi:hypothetical protein
MYIDINKLFDIFSTVNNVEVKWMIESYPYKGSNGLAVELIRGDKSVKSIYLYPLEGCIDLVLLKERLDVQLCELEREEANNG